MEMDEKAVKEYLREKGVNPLLLDNPAFDVSSRIMDMATKAYYRLPNRYTNNSDYDDMIKFILDTGISVDEKGNVSMLDTVEKSRYNPSSSRKKQAFSINENGEFVYQSMFKTGDLSDTNEFRQYRIIFALEEKVYNQEGIEMVRRDKKYQCYKDSVDDALYLTENEYFLSSEAYDDSLISSYASTSVRETKRNYDLGSARIEYRGGLNVKEDFACNVRLLGEAIDRLVTDYDTMELLLNISKVDNLVEWRENNPSINFGQDMTVEERDAYYEWLNREISLIVYSDKRAAMQRMVQERGLISSNMLIEGMANGTIDINCQPINYNDNVVNNTRSMGYSAIWLLGLSSAVLSIGILIIGTLLR